MLIITIKPERFVSQIARLLVNDAHDKEALRIAAGSAETHSSRNELPLLSAIIQAARDKSPRAECRRDWLGISGGETTSIERNTRSLGQRRASQSASDARATLPRAANPQRGQFYSHSPDRKNSHLLRKSPLEVIPLKRRRQAPQARDVIPPGRGNSPWLRGPDLLSEWRYAVGQTLVELLRHA